ncbi:hypothetical protein BC831DRAFT_95532 [Entophlyctis helioformis]|nr:hypothetical protein BC831DRAFT_95532 [Entophlyctis helioformis]
MADVSEHSQDAKDEDEGNAVEDYDPNAPPPIIVLQSSDGDTLSVDLAPSMLMMWSQVLRTSHPGSLSSLSSGARAVIREAVMEFLSDYLGDVYAKRCVLPHGKNKVMEPAIPVALIEQFHDWFDTRVDDGLLDNASKKRPRKSAPGHMESTPAPASHRSPSGYTIASTGKSAKPQADSSPSGPASEPPSRPANQEGLAITSPHSQWSPWTDIVRAKYPGFTVKMPGLSNFIQAFVAEHNLPIVKKRSNAPHVAAQSLALPPELQLKFIGAVERTYSGRREWTFQATKGPLRLPIVRDDNAEGGAAARAKQETRAAAEVEPEADADAGKSTRGQTEEAADVDMDGAAPDSAATASQSLKKSPAKSPAKSGRKGKGLSRKSREPEEPVGGEAEEEEEEEVVDSSDWHQPFPTAAAAATTQSTAGSSADAGSPSGVDEGGVVGLKRRTGREGSPSHKIARTETYATETEPARVESDSEAAMEASMKAALDAASNVWRFPRPEDEMNETRDSHGSGEEGEAEHRKTLARASMGPSSSVSASDMGKTGASVPPEHRRHTIALPPPPLLPLPTSIAQLSTTSIATAESGDMQGNGDGGGAAGGQGVAGGTVDPLTRYNHVLKSMMPAYNATPKERRVEMKRLVKNYLMEKMGDAFTSCILFSTRGKETHHTYGIMRSLEPEFRQWAIVEMQRLFGDAVPTAF